MKHTISCTKRIENIHLSLHNVEAVRSFSFGTWTSRQHIFVCLESQGVQGWGENIITVNKPDVSLEQWLKWLEELKGNSVDEAFALLRKRMGIWTDRLTELLEIALVDLAGKLEKESALSLLGLNKADPVNGAYVILTDKLDIVEKGIQKAIAQGTSQVVKVKLFGEQELDKAIIKMVRHYAPRPRTYLIGDVNCGYRPKDTQRPLSEIRACMDELFSVGLDACEDPAFLDNQEWVTLQKLCPLLSFIPDYPMRPSSEAIKTLLPKMGKVYNIHPGSAGSLFDAIDLARHIQKWGAGLMIGDDSLIGPSCTAWQQIAIGLGADWVEAIEKEQDSDGFYAAVKSFSTKSSTNPITMKNDSYGFGVEMDLALLEKSASKSFHL